MTYNKINNVLGWLCGVLATTVYLITADRYNSWWDTGEFIASAYRLEIVHQPGAPLFLLLQNLFSNLALGHVERVAYWMNIGSAICSGLSIVFLFWTITALARKVIKVDNSGSAYIQIFGAGLVGALGYSFTDTFWYSAVESEVYAMSSLCTAAVFWLALKWERRADEADANRWLLLITYVMGLSIGVHLLNLLTIPALALVVYFRKSSTVSWQGGVKSLGWGLLILAFILWGVIQYTVKIAADFDLFFVNSLGLPFGSGIFLFVTLLVAGLVYGIYYSIRSAKPVMNVAILGVCFVLLGFSSYSMLIIRAQTNIALNNNSPDNVFSFLGYLSREQYIKEPLFRGQNFDAKVVAVEPTTFYRKDKKRYTAVEGNSKVSYDREVLFPRLYSDKHAGYYKQYLGLPEGQSPTLMDNIKFFFSYQIGHLYTRYFLWNFAGRQNDKPGHGNYTEGNWISGVKWLDDWRLGGQYALSDGMKSDASRNVYFMLPLLLGLIGLSWHYRRAKRDLLVVGLLFLFTGIAIVVYLNQTPMQPRERDYAYAGSFYVFSIWMGFGAIGLMEMLRKKLSQKVAAKVALILALIVGPVLLVVENWDDHDRSGRGMSREFAINYLESCAPDAILFTYADNDTFPLWYLQEVEGRRTDVRIVNLSYLQSDWYVRQQMQEINQAKRLPITFDISKVDKGVRDVIYFYDLGIDQFTDVDRLVDIMLSDNPKDKLTLQNGQSANVLPTRQMQLKVDKDSAIRHQAVPTAWQHAIPDVMQWSYNKGYVTRAELILMHLLTNNNWERPIYFAGQMPSDCFAGLDKYLVSEGLLYRLMPVDMGQPSDRTTLVNKDTLYTNITNSYVWSDIRSLAHFDTDSNFMYENFVLPQVFLQGITACRQDGETEKAGDIARVAYEHMPAEVKSMRQVWMNSLVVDTLYKVQEQQKAHDLAARNLRYLEHELDYQLAVYQKKKGGIDGNGIRLGMESIEAYKEILAENADTHLLAHVGNLAQKYEHLIE